MRPAKFSRKTTLIILSVILIAVLAFVAGRYFIFRQIRSTLHERIVSLRQKGISIQFESATINAWTGKIEVQQLLLKLGKDSLHYGLEANVPYLLLKGIAVLPFLTDHSLTISSVSLMQPTVSVTLNTALFDMEKGKMLLENININTASLTEVLLYIKDRQGKDTLVNLSADMRIKQLGIVRERDSLTWKDADIGITNLQAKFPAELYSCAVKQLQLSLTDKTFRVDSLKIAPTTDRKTFMKKYGKEIDYISAVVPLINIHGVNLYAYPEPTLEAKKIALNFKINVFRDKRYPFRKSHHTTLPTHFLQRLPLQLNVDTISLTDSYVSYEEFQEESDSSGRIYFEDLNATITAVHNNASYHKEAFMKARAKFMGAGDLTVNFTFPSDTLKPYRATGSLKGLPLVRLNDILGPAAKARIESGVMTNMKFNFLYNQYRSDGKVELNYKNLKVSSLHADKNNKQAVSVIKTLLLNAFIIKKNMDEDVRDEEKTGTILFYRDTKRSIFNYWWKSIFSGIKSAYKLDKLPVANRNGERKNLFRRKKNTQEAKLSKSTKGE